MVVLPVSSHGRWVLMPLAALCVACGSSSTEPTGSRPRPAPSGAASKLAQPGDSPGDSPGGSSSDSPGDSAPGPARCTATTFASLLRFPEASGATYVRDAEAPHVLIVGDSGTDGTLARVALDTGAIVSTSRLPLDRGASDDLEGLSMIGDMLYGVTSSGWIRRWRADRSGTWKLDQPAYALAPPGKARGANQRRWVCASGHKTNCARNYEGLCLRHDARPGDGCAGFAASKDDGALYCLTLAPGGRLVLDPDRAIAVSAGETLTGCHFEVDGAALWAGTNLFGANRVYRVTGWQDPGRARVRDIGALGSGFVEAIALAPGGVVYRFSDMGGSTSLVDRYICD